LERLISERPADRSPDKHCSIDGGRRGDTEVVVQHPFSASVPGFKALREEDADVENLNCKMDTLLSRVAALEGSMLGECESELKAREGLVSQNLAQFGKRDQSGGILPPQRNVRATDFGECRDRREAVALPWEEDDEISQNICAQALPEGRKPNALLDEHAENVDELAKMSDDVECSLGGISNVWMCVESRNLERKEPLDPLGCRRAQVHSAIRIVEDDFDQDVRDDDQIRNKVRRSEHDSFSFEFKTAKDSSERNADAHIHDSLGNFSHRGGRTAMVQDSRLLETLFDNRSGRNSTTTMPLVPRLGVLERIERLRAQASALEVAN